MDSGLRLLVSSSLLYLISGIAGTMLSIRDHLPAQFGGIISGDNVFLDFLTWMGTALSPPLALLLAQVVLTVFVFRPGRVKVGIVGLTILGAMYTLGQLGEPILGQALSRATFGWVPVILVANILFSVLMLVFGAMAWRSRWRTPTTRPASR